MFQYSVTPMLSIRPNRISLTQSIVKLFKQENGTFLNKYTFPKDEADQVAPTTSAAQKKLEKKFHNFELSVNSARNLKDKISYLFQYAKSRTIKTSTGKTIPNFKVAFITLTLPTKQKHSTAEITSVCLDDFLQKCRRYLNMQNYVWRMEFQANGNVHYHLATDSYIDYFWLLKEWNRSLNKLNYINDYQHQMQGLSYSEYKKRYSQGGQIPAQTLYKRYQQGVAYKWTNPNSVDVKNAKNSDNIAFYISKYFSKKEKSAKCNPLDNEANSFALRLCFWSRSLSRCKAESMPLDYYSADIVRLFEYFKAGFKKVYDYATVYYFNFFELPKVLKSIIGQFFSRSMLEDKYIPAS